jgi:hypothetical protein
MATVWRTFQHNGKISLAWWGWGVHAHPPPFTLSTISYKVVVYAAVVRADTLPLLLLYPYIFSVQCACTSKRHLEKFSYREMRTYNTGLCSNKYFMADILCIAKIL